MRWILFKNEKFMISFNLNESFERGCFKCMKKFSVMEGFIVEQFMILVILLNDGYNNNVVCNKYLIIKIYYLIICNYYFYIY